MAGIELKVTGAKKLADRLRQSGRDVDRMTAASLRAAALLIQNEAKRRAPKRTSTLRRSIMTEIVKLNATAYAARIGPSAPHGKYVELGTGIYAEGGDGRKTPWVYMVAPGKFVTTHGMKAQPYMRPAFDEKSAAAIAEFRRIYRGMLTEGS